MISKITSQIAPRIVIGLTGGGLGIITIIPNIMISDSGSPMAMCGATIGLYASASFVGGGLLGAIFKHPIFLLPGMVLQIGAFTIPPIISKLGLIESEKEYWKKQHSLFSGHYFIGIHPEKTFFAKVDKKNIKNDEEK